GFIGDSDLLQRLAELFSFSGCKVPDTFELTDFAELVECSWSFSDELANRQMIKGDFILFYNARARTGQVIIRYKFRIFNPKFELPSLTLLLKGSDGSVLSKFIKPLSLAVVNNSLQIIEFAVDCKLISGAEQVQLLFEDEIIKILQTLGSGDCVNKEQLIGKTFKFGQYPQGPNGEVEPIVWRVLRRDTGSLLVIADMGLDCKRYNESRCDITWSDCTLRRWLNDEFYKKAFNEQEQSLIKKATLANNAGPSTEDNVFLLSVDEAESLFANNNDRICKPTGYVVKNGVSTDNNGAALWWLRSRYHTYYYASYVSGAGSFSYTDNVNNDFTSIRPALQLAI
ncbi:hypothetical protein IJT10_07705, partial [bacterium]|nr:hypothetical protein [bacterium]